MNYYEFLNKKFTTEPGKQLVQTALEVKEDNPFASSVFNKDDNSVKIDGASIFANAKKEDVSKIDFSKMTTEAEAAQDFKKLNPLEFVLKCFMSIDKIKELVDKNKDGNLSVDEIKAYVTDLAAKDGNADELTLADFEKVIEENKIDLEELLNTENVEDTAEAVEESAGGESVDSAASDDYSAGSVGEASYSAPVDDVSSYDDGAWSDYSGQSQSVESSYDKTLEQLEAEKETRVNTLKEKQTALAAAQSGDTPAIKAAKVEFDKAKEEYENAINEDPGLKEYADDIKANLENIDKNTEAIDKNDKAITDKESEISTAESALDSLKSSLAALELSLSALPAPSGKEEDKEKDAQIVAKKTEIQSAIDAKKAEVQEQESKLEALKKELEELNTEKTKLEEEKTKLEEEKQKLDELVKKFGNEVTKAKLEAYNKAKANLEAIKAKEVEKAKAEVKTAQDSVKEIEAQIATKKAQEEVQQYVGTGGEGSVLKPGLFKGALAGKEQVVTDLCNKYGVDPKLVASIIGLESGWGTSNLAQHNNFMGYRKAGDAGVNRKGFGYFSTPEKGLEAAIKNLANYTRFSDVASVDFEHLDSIGRHYCDGQWASAVRRMHNSRVNKYVA
ncbi:MAG: glucosaminidase domain-containing protein [Muribaculaceae bacterium]|nr:glucosaminidase domain-containing protein [Muribaculaceae bacterium]